MAWADTVNRLNASVLAHYGSTWTLFPGLPREVDFQAVYSAPNSGRGLGGLQSERTDHVLRLRASSWASLGGQSGDYVSGAAGSFKVADAQPVDDDWVELVLRPSA